MVNSHIKYIEGVKYQLVEDYTFRTEIVHPSEIHTEFIVMVPMDGYSLCTVSSGYAWDGPSGPTIDTLNFMRASLEHDIKYELMRKELISRHWRDIADRELYDTCIKDGMSPGRAGYVYRGVRDFAFYASDPKNKRVVITAPKEVKV